MFSHLNRLFLRASQPLLDRIKCNTRTYISIPEFYRDRAVLVTGATGFLGQGLVEKLLRSCPDIARIYISIKPDKYGDAEQKFREFLQNEVFKQLQTTNRTFDSKIVPFKGDITEVNIGMDRHMVTEITEGVSVIFHCAADIRLNPTLRDSIEGNVLGSKNVFELGKKCRNLCAYVHVSTTFSNYDMNHVEEKIYAASSSPEELIRLIQQHGDGYLLKRQRQIVTSNLAYTFCKKVAENVVMDRDLGGKTAVFRSCFISPALSEPFPYWMFGHAGYILIMNNVNKETLRYMQGNPTNPVENLPVDMIVNSLISVGWYVGTERHTKTEPLVVNVNSSIDNLVTLKDLEETVREYHGNRRSPGFKIISNRTVYMLLTVPAVFKVIFKDVLGFLKGEHPKNLQHQLKLRKAVRYLETSTLRHPTYEFENAKEIHNLLSDSDKQIFPFDVKSIQWKSYLHNWIKTLEGSTKSKQK